MNKKHFQNKTKITQEQRVEGRVGWRSPSNKALVIYWGKYGLQLSKNPSLSFTLKNSATETTVSFITKSNKKLDFDFKFEGKQNEKFNVKIKNLLKNTHNVFPFLSQIYLDIESTNNFPHSAGIASSAASMSALALCLCSIEAELNPKIKINNAFYEKASYVSRIGSGSASRSVFGGYSMWGKSKYIPGSSNEFAVPVKDIHSKFMKLRDAILIVDSGEKKISSTQGHNLMNNHPYSEARFKEAKDNIGVLYQALKKGDENKFIEVVEWEGLDLNAMMMTSKPSYTLLRPGSLEIIDRVRNYREKSGTFICFSFDAGPSPHLLYFEKDKTRVRAFIKKDLLRFCENRQWIDDQIGAGPAKII